VGSSGVRGSAGSSGSSGGSHSLMGCIGWVICIESTGTAMAGAWTAGADGWYFLQLRLSAKTGPVPYRLSLVRKRS